MTLYNLKTDGDQYRITKFTNNLDVESSYLLALSECECPAGSRPTCRHRQMLPEMLAYDMANTNMFYDFETKVVLQSTVEEYPEVEAEPLKDKPELTGLQEDQILMSFHNVPHPSIGPIKRRI
jgi:hypothetical protein